MSDDKRNDQSILPGGAAPIIDIPKDRPVLGSDLHALKNALGLTVDDARWVFGISMNRWGDIVQKNADKPVKNPTIALLVRYFAMFPNKCPVPDRPSAEEVQKATDATLKRLGVLLGKEHVSGFRWIKLDRNMAPSAGRLAIHLNEEAKKGNLRWWEENLVEVEARARGVNDIFRSGSWKSKEEKAQDRADASTKKAAPKPRKAPAKKPAKPSETATDDGQTAQDTVFDI